MSLHRTIKKAAYASGFFAFLFVLVTLIALPWLRSDTSNTPTQTQTAFIPVTLEDAIVIPHIAKPGPKGKTIDIVARIKNENPRAGTKSYPVTFTVHDAAGGVISRFVQDAYVLPGGLQYIVALDVPIPSDKTLGNVEVTPGTAETLVPLPDTARLPDFSVFLRDRKTVGSGAYTLEQQTGIVTNNSTFDWERVEVTGIALDANGKIVGVGKTFVGKLLIGEQREFALQWPLPEGATSRVLAIATTNIYSDANIVHIVGDPGKLR